MADQKLKFIAEYQDKGLKKGINEASKSIESMRKQMDMTAKLSAQKYAASQEEAANSSARAKQATDNFKQSLAFVATAMGVAVVAGKQLYEAIGQGAQIELAAIKFDRLATSIGTTGDALRFDLAQATDGLMSQAEQMQLAGDLMSLGLAKTHDQAVRLSAVASQLGMDMNQLTLTLSNETTMRFDSLGVAVDGFDEILQNTIETGGTFTDAFLVQAENQIEKVGSVAETTAGQLMQFEATWKDFGDTLKVTTAEAVVPFIDRWTRVVKLNQAGEISKFRANVLLFSEAAIENAEAAAQVDTSWKDFYTTLKVNDGVIDDAGVSLDGVRENMDGVNRSILNNIESWQKDIEWIQSGGYALQQVAEQAMKDYYDGAIDIDEAQRRVKVSSIAMVEKMAVLEDMSLDQITQAFVDLGYELDEARILAGGVNTQISAIDGAEATADIYINVHGKVPKFPGQDPYKGDGGVTPANELDAPTALQAGRDFIVPQNMTGDSGLVRVTAGERVSVGTASNTLQDMLAQKNASRQSNQELANMIVDGLLSAGVV